MRALSKRLVVLVALAASACGYQGADTGVASAPIISGSPTEESYPQVCAITFHVTQAWLDFTGGGFGDELGKLRTMCSGTLLSPTVLLTAGHCAWFEIMGLYRAAGVTCAPTFDENTPLVTGHYVHHPDSDLPNGLPEPEVAVFLLDSPIRVAHYGEMAEVGEVEEIFAEAIAHGKGGPRVTSVGYGTNLNNDPAVTRRSTTVRPFFIDEWYLWVEPAPGLPSMHDSGSPMFLASSRKILATMSFVDAFPPTIALGARSDLKVIQDFVNRFLPPGEE